MLESIQNKVAYITGGSKGIGFGIAEAILKNGGKVAITSRSLSSAEEAAVLLREKTDNDQIMALEADVRKLDSQQIAVDTIIDKWGKIDVVVANAGIGHFGSIDDLSVEQWQDTIDTNLTGVFNTIKCTVEALKSSKGYFMTIGSLAGTNFFAGGAAYNASKFGVTGFTQAVMLDLRKYGIRTTTIMPGSVATYFNNHEPSVKDSWKIQIEDIGEIVINLLRLNSRTLPSKIEVRPSMPPST